MTTYDRTINEHPGLTRDLALSQSRLSGEEFSQAWDAYAYMVMLLGQITHGADPSIFYLEMTVPNLRERVLRDLGEEIERLRAGTATRGGAAMTMFGRTPP